MSAATLPGLPRTVLRLHRAALGIWGVFVVGMITWLVLLNEVTAGQVRGSDAPFASLDYAEPVSWIATFICDSFLAVAAFAGGALVGRELESGTARLAWTQGVTPTRWLAAKLAVPAAVIALGGTMLVLAFRWGWGAHRELMGDNWTFPDVFVARGPAAVAYALCALAVGALTALLLRRTLPSLGVSLAAMWLLNFFLERYRDALWPAVTRVSSTRFEVPDSVLQVENGTIVGGRRVEGLDYVSCDGTPAEMKRCIDDMGITGYYATYHPQSHFWPLHLVETGIVLAVAAAATTAAFAVLRRRTA